MLKSKAFWYGNMAGGVGAWIFGISGLLCPFENPSIRITSLIIFWSFLILHPFELAMSIPICKKAGIPLWKTVVFTMIFGFLWWLPVKMEVFKE